MMLKLLKKYTVPELIYLALCFIRGKIISKNIRLIRFPIQLRNRSQIQFGKGFTTGVGCRLEVEHLIEKGNDVRAVRLFIADNVQINDYVHITAVQSVRIGNNVLIASKVYISDVAHGDYRSKNPSLPSVPPVNRSLICNPVIIEDNVWLGEGVCVLPGVTIGYGSIIGANSVVTRSVPAMCIAAGIPAKIVKKFNQTSGQWEVT